MRVQNLAILLIVVLGVQFVYPGGWMGVYQYIQNQQQPVAPVGPGTPQPPAPPATAYIQDVALTLNNLWAYDESDNAITNAVYPVYHKDWSLAHAGLAD